MNKKEQISKIQEALYAYLGLDKTDTQDWDEHAETVGKTTEATDVKVLTLIEKVEVVLNKNLDDLISNEIAIENALELQTLINAVVNFNAYIKNSPND